MSDNTFYDTDGASNLLKRPSRNHNNDSNVARMIGCKIDEHDTPNFMLSDWASTAEEASSFYDDRSSALKSLVGPEYRSISSNKSSRGAYSFNHIEPSICFCYFAFETTKFILTNKIQSNGTHHQKKNK